MVYNVRNDNVITYFQDCMHSCVAVHVSVFGACMHVDVAVHVCICACVHICST